MEDGRIVDLFLRRDESAIRYSARQYGQRLRTLARDIVGDRETAEECENDTYLAAWQAIPPHEPRSWLYAFLARITRHISIDCCRSRTRLKRGGHVTALAGELEQCIPAPDDCACRLEELALAEALNGFLADLPREKRDLFLRRYWYLDSISHISRRFALSESAVKTALHRLRGQLRAYLEKEGYSL